ncbi:pyridoxamine 5'-phosphate oxidase family protein [Actinomadura barringtoniae]|uniref:Pyridoxamine 5'-phosphate oxidase family protein n=1 Tax=Actinomadura barringtoniae TaxID=1427535 RepID=A0A939P638_9ACTN|nr:pyridoxamine 5'-phosphate oxidase family protein [Actinomadura barringtoniae]MBO2446111.1 pyridoxamine 5'-phosphate oxidase family protein [Actinomadura barringtoniae]
MRFDQGGLEILGADECRTLLGSAPLGRVVFTDQALPAVQPVNFALLDGDVIIRTSVDSKLSAAAEGAIVAFEVDDFDAAAHTGWSVVAVGEARVVRDPGERAELDALPLRSWAPGERDQFIRIRLEMLRGRRIPGGSPTPERTPG